MNIKTLSDFTAMVEKITAQNTVVAKQSNIAKIHGIVLNIDEFIMLKKKMPIYPIFFLEQPLAPMFIHQFNCWGLPIYTRGKNDTYRLIRPSIERTITECQVERIKEVAVFYDKHLGELKTAILKTGLSSSDFDSSMLDLAYLNLNKNKR